MTAHTQTAGEVYMQHLEQGPAAAPRSSCATNKSANALQQKGPTATATGLSETALTPPTPVLPPPLLLRLPLRVSLCFSLHLSRSALQSLTPGRLLLGASAAVHGSACTGPVAVALARRSRVSRGKPGCGCPHVESISRATLGSMPIPHLFALLCRT